MPGAPWPWSLPSRSQTDYKKQLEGVTWTPALRALVQDCLDKATDSGNETSPASSRPSVSLERAQAALVDGVDLDAPILPLSVLRALVTILQHEDASAQQGSDSTGLTKLEEALGGDTDKTEKNEKPSLFFTPPPPAPEDTVDRQKWETRMKRLRLRAEETRYQKLTNNLNKDKADDDVTAKSMMYAASVGLNMIVAPISFGVFMYFFAGQIFEWVLDEADAKEIAANQHRTDIRKVIAGVVGGVGMLFVEMLLFVIRTHTLEESVARKKRKNKGPSPFGYTKPVVKDDDGAAASTTPALPEIPKSKDAKKKD